MVLVVALTDDLKAGNYGNALVLFMVALFIAPRTQAEGKK